MQRIDCSLAAFLLAIDLICATQVCSKTCNDNGFCYIDNGIEKCKCMERIYVGDTCNELVDYCKENPCKNGGKCAPSPGQYNCEFCPENTYGQNCTITSEKRLFGQIYLQYNHIAPVSNDNYYLIIVTETVGTVQSMVEMLTPGYAIVGGLTLPSRDFVQTNNIQEIAKSVGVPSSDLPSGSVFYYVGKYRMELAGTALVTLTITDANASTSDLYYKWDFQFGSRKNVGCNPSIQIRSCGTPTSPVKFNLKQTFFVEASVQRDCGRDSTMSYHWSISNYFDTNTLQTFNANSRVLNIPPFGIQINYDVDDVFSALNLVRLVSMERSADGKRIGESLNRCYIFITVDGTVAKIAGGERQEYSHHQQIIMDGSDSVDMSLHPMTNQNLLYSWQCSSSNNDEYCKELNETGLSI